MRRAAAAALAALLLPGAARAHGIVAGGGSFYAGMLHPLVVPAHLLVLVGLGLLIGRPGRGQDAALLAFATAMLAGLLAAGAHLAPPPPAPAALAIAAAAGLLVAAGAGLPSAAGAALAVMAGAAIGLDSAPDAPMGRGWGAALAGTWLGAGLVLLLLAHAARAARRSWQVIGIRVLGSWTAASALLVLALWVRR